MTHADWLQTLAEIGIGFAGFSALIAGMRRRDDQPDRMNASRGRAVVETALSVIFGATTPVLLHGMGLSEVAAFRYSGGLFFLVGAPLTFMGFRRAIATRTRGETNRPVLTTLMLVASAAGLGFSLACVIGIPTSAIPTYYMAALTGILGISAINFIGFVFAIDEESLDQRG